MKIIEVRALNRGGREGVTVDWSCILTFGELLVFECLGRWEDFRIWGGWLVFGSDEECDILGRERVRGKKASFYR